MNLSCILELRAKTSSKGIFKRLLSKVALKRRFSSISRILGEQQKETRGMDRTKHGSKVFLLGKMRKESVFASFQGKTRKNILRVFSEDRGAECLPPARAVSPDYCIPYFFNRW